VNRLGNGEGTQKNPEAAFHTEFYRAVHQLTGGRVIPSPEFSDHSIGLQRIDFRIAEANWGVELLKDGNNLLEHYGRFTAGGKYTTLGLVDWAVIDFRVSMPCKAHNSMPNLYHVVFDEDFLTGQILNNTLERVLSEFRLSP